MYICTDRQWSFEALPPELFSQKILNVTQGRIETHKGQAAFLEAGPTGQYGLSYQENFFTKTGTKTRLTSAVDPTAEDRALVSRSNLNPQEGVVCLGLGLGYQVEELLKHLEPGVGIWIFESRPELAACAFLHRDLNHLLNHPEVHFILGPFDQNENFDQNQIFKQNSEQNSYQNSYQNFHQKLPSQILWRPATLRHFASEYPFLPPESNPKSALKPGGLQTRSRIPKVLLFQSGYFLDREIKNAAQALGWETSVWNFQRSTKASEANFKELFSLIKSFQPSMVLTVNHLGFDAEGILDDLFTKIKIPVATWFVDSPTFILGEVKPGPGVTAFSWDRDYLPLLSSQGFREVHYLPLAADEIFFHSPQTQPPSPVREVAFVGDSLAAATSKYLVKLGLGPHDPRTPSFLKAVDRETSSFLSSPELIPPEKILRELAELAGLNPSVEKLNDLAALVTWRGSRLKRLEILRAVDGAGTRLTVAGDKGWVKILKLGDGGLLPVMDYYTELSSFYQGSQVNLNITSAQMKSGLNQRIFDVPASGSFLLTDDQGQLEELFEPGQEVITYRHPEEARDLALWYIQHPVARQDIVIAGQHRLHQHHLYRHRLARLAAIMGV